MSTLEQRITAALLDATIASTAIAALLEETQTALTEADANIEAERKKALDPLQSPDPVKAREAIGAAEFSRDRLRALQPRLLQHYKKAEAAEYAVAWEADLPVSAAALKGSSLRRVISIVSPRASRATMRRATKPASGATQGPACSDRNIRCESNIGSLNDQGG